MVPEMRGDEERKHETYFLYVDCLNDEGNEVDWVPERVLDHYFGDGKCLTQRLHFLLQFINLGHVIFGAHGGNHDFC